MTEYDIAKIFDDMELELIESMHGHMSVGLKGTSDEWKKRQLQEIKRFRKDNEKIIKKYQEMIKGDTETFLKEEYIKGELEQFNYLKEHSFGQLRKKLKTMVNPNSLTGIDDRRMIALMDAVIHDMDKAIYSAYRLCNDVYRETIFKSTVLVNSGQYDLVSAIDVAQQDFLNKGIDSIVYANGAHIAIRSYAEMALRTNAIRCGDMGKGMLRDILECYTVRVSHHQSSCPKCGPWQGKILIDDVYSKGKADGKYPLLSEAIEQGLRHPNCRHNISTYDPEVDDDYEVKQYTEKDKERYKNEQKQRELERNIRKAKRKAKGSMDPDVRREEEKLVKHLEANPLLKRKKWRENP